MWGLASFRQESERSLQVFMIANQILHTAIRDVKRITGGKASVWDTKGMCLAGVENTDKKIEADMKEILDYIGGLRKIRKNGTSFFLIEEDGVASYVLVLDGLPENEAHIAGAMAVCQIENLQNASREQLGKNRFYQSLLLDNMLLADVYAQAKRLHIRRDAGRVVYVIAPQSGETEMAMEIVRNLIGLSEDFVTAVEEGEFVLVKTFEGGEEKNIKTVGHMLADTLEGELLEEIKVSYGLLKDDLKGVSKSYKEAKIAMEVGKIFYVERAVSGYPELGIGRLIHQLPVSLCRMYLEEVFGADPYGLFEEDTLAAVNKFFENNLNISETARQLYLHRNTLVYRLEKIEKRTGLDVRTFDDALSFKIAMMVAEHLNYLETKKTE